MSETIVNAEALTRLVRVAEDMRQELDAVTFGDIRRRAWNAIECFAGRLPEYQAVLYDEEATPAEAEAASPTTQRG